MPNADHDTLVPPPLTADLGEAPPRPDTWVPPDQRVLGIDKRSFAPALAVVALALVLAYLVPAVESTVESANPVAAGDVVDLAGARLVFTPAVGWNLDEGLRYDPTRQESPSSTSTVSDGDVQVSVETGRFSGTPDELLDQINEENEDLRDERGLGSSGGRTSVTVNGAEGVAETFTGLSEKGVVVALVFDDVDGQSLGTQITIRGSSQSIADRQDEIAAMVDSIRLLPEPTTEAGS